MIGLRYFFNEGEDDRLFDEDDDGPISLIDNGCWEWQSFDQIALIPYRSSVYFILKPLFDMPGVDEDEGVVFKYIPSRRLGSGRFKTDPCLERVENDIIMEKVSALYGKLFDEEPEVNGDDE